MHISQMTILVTGAAKGIGRALASGFAAEGAHVVGLDVDAGALPDIEAAGCVARRADVSVETDVSRAIAELVEERGRLDVLINNAGLGIPGSVEGSKVGDYESMFEVNVLGPVYGMRHAIPIMRQQGSGRIINLLSRSAENRLPGAGAYNGTKAALWAITRSVAAETKGSGILVNGLIPGPVKTAMNPIGTETPDSAWRTARMLATFGNDGPSGQVFWNEREYVLFSNANEAYAA